MHRTLPQPWVRYGRGLQRSFNRFSWQNVQVRDGTSKRTKAWLERKGESTIFRYTKITSVKPYLLVYGRCFTARADCTFGMQLAASTEKE